MRRDLWEMCGRVLVGLRLAKGQGEREAAATGVAAEPTGSPGAGWSCRAVLPWGKGARSMHLQGLVTAFGLP